MPWFSLLPAHLTIVETWIIRFFVSSPLYFYAHDLTSSEAPSWYNHDWTMAPRPRLRHGSLPLPRGGLRDPTLWWQSTGQAAATGPNADRAA